MKLAVGKLGGRNPEDTHDGVTLVPAAIMILAVNIDYTFLFNH